MNNAYCVQISHAPYIHYTQELQGQLHSAMKEVDDLRDARERQKEMVSAVVKQRERFSLNRRRCRGIL